MSNEKKFIQNKLSEIKSEKIDVSQKLSIKYFLNEIKMFLRSFKFKKCRWINSRFISSNYIFKRLNCLKIIIDINVKHLMYDSLNNLENFVLHAFIAPT